MFETGKSHAAAGRLDQALRAFEEARKLEPRSVDLLVEYGYALKDVRRLEEARSAFSDAHDIDPRSVRVLNGYGLVLADLDRADEALKHFTVALALQPDQPLVLSNAGAILTRLGRIDEAIEACVKALAARPEFAPALIHLSLALAATTQPYRYTEALPLLADTASTDATVMQGKAIALQTLNRDGEALDVLKRAAARDPNDVVAAALLSTQALLMGDFETGWNTFEARWQAPGGAERPYADQIKTPIWDGSAPLAGRSFFVYTEQGHGDTIQFSRYCAMLAERGADVSFAVQDALEPVLRGLPGVTRLLTSGHAVPRFDLHSPVMSLPRAFATRLDSIPPQPRPLVALPERLQKWQKLLGEKKGPRVALAWSGNPAHSNDLNRSVPLAMLLPLLQLEIDFVSLQRAVPLADEDVLKHAARLCDLRGEIDDFGDMAAIIALSDVVVSVDTASVHLAGAMGWPTFICLPRRPDWRFLLDRSDTPWYPSARLFRQPQAGDWQTVVASLAKALRERFHGAA
jgi:Flp pilus assembly protein TadD/ADP-heptose:LPS heptosyltransferase